MNTKTILKLAQEFDRKVNPSGIFGVDTLKEDANKLHSLAGKLKYRAELETDPQKKERLLGVAKLVLQAGDMLKSV